MYLRDHDKGTSIAIRDRRRTEMCCGNNKFTDTAFTALSMGGLAEVVDAVAS